MAQPSQQSQSRPKPMDSLQGMLNGVLIETGKALKHSNTKGNKAHAGFTSRPNSTIPGLCAQFHQTLDEFEIEIKQAKSVLLRDLEAQRAKRIVFENPTPIVEQMAEPVSQIAMMSVAQPQPKTLEKPTPLSQLSKSPTIKKEVITDSPKKSMSTIATSSKAVDPPKASIVKAVEPLKPAQVQTPPSSGPDIKPVDSKTIDSKSIGLGINTEAKTDMTTVSNPTATDTSADSLFDPNMDVDFDLDFFNTDTQTDQTQIQGADFNITHFGSGSATQPSAGTDIPTGGIVTSSTDDIVIKPLGDLLDLEPLEGGDNMDLDLNLDMFGAEDSVFDDMFVDGGLSAGGGGEMEHGNFDNAFFGLND